MSPTDILYFGGMGLILIVTWLLAMYFIRPLPTQMYLDDERPTPKGWERVYTAHEAIQLLRMGHITEVSLDHDLGDLDGDCGDGYEVACWIEEQAYFGTLAKLKWNVHSANPTGAEKMRMALRQADEYWDGKYRDPQPLDW